MRALSALAVAMLLACHGPASAAGVKTAVFPFGLIDTSQEGEANGVRADQTRRLGLITSELDAMLKKDGRYDPADLSPVEDQIEKVAPIYSCNGCEDALAKKVGAKLAIVGTVQKVSNLILNINLYIRDIEKQRIVREYSVDVRGNTDETWSRSLRYLVKNRLFEEPVPQ